MPLKTSIIHENYHVSKFLISKKVDINFYYFNQCLIEIVFGTKNLYLIYYFLYIGVVFSQEIQEDCIQSFAKEPKFQNSVKLIISDYNNQKLWSPKSNRYFPDIFKQILFKFLLSLKLFSFKIGIRIPRYVTYLFVENFVTDQIKTNQEINK